jgi:hypothetical protein
MGYKKPVRGWYKKPASPKTRRGILKVEGLLLKSAEEKHVNSRNLTVKEMEEESFLQNEVENNEEELKNEVGELSGSTQPPSTSWKDRFVDGEFINLMEQWKEDQVPNHHLPRADVSGRITGILRKKKAELGSPKKVKHVRFWDEEAHIPEVLEKEVEAEVPKVPMHGDQKKYSGQRKLYGPTKEMTKVKVKNRARVLLNMGTEMLEKATIQSEATTSKALCKAVLAISGKNKSTGRTVNTIVGKTREDLGPPLPKGEFYNNLLTARIANKNFTMLVDTGADYSIFPMESMPKSAKDQIRPWRGQEIWCALNKRFDIVGEWLASMIISGNKCKARFCVVADKMTNPILGMDWQKHYQVARNWVENTISWKPFGKSGANADIVNYDGVPLRTMNTIAFIKGVQKIFEVAAPEAKVDTEWLVEPVIWTSGALRVPRQVCRCTTEGKLEIAMANFDKEDVLVSNNTMVAFAEQINKNSVMSAKSFREFKESTSKEDVEMAKIGVHPAPLTKRIREFLKNWQVAFAKNPLSPPKLSTVEPLEINTGDLRPAKVAPRRSTPEQAHEMAKQEKMMLENDIIEESKGPWGAPTVLAKKKDGSWRYCVDYRYLNAGTKKDAYPLPKIEEALETLSNEKAKIFSTLDLASGYWHIPITEADKEKTGFMGKTGQYQFKVTPFGLTGAPGIFCKALNSTLAEDMWETCMVYVDDVIVWSETVDEHFKDLENIFTKLNNKGFKLKLSKCEFFVTEVNYLGFVISNRTIGLDPAKVKAISEFPIPTTKKELQRFLGMVNWYARWIPHKSSLCTPLNELLTIDPKEWKWEINSEAFKSFEGLKAKLVCHPLLRLPDFKKPFYIVTDASDYGVAAVLTQIHNNYEHPISYYATGLKGSQRFWVSYKKEMYALVKGLRHFKHYVQGNHEVFAVTDCRALAHFNTTIDIPAQVQRWLVELEQASVKFIHRPGKRMPVPDTLSRNPKFVGGMGEVTHKKADIDTPLREKMTTEFGKYNFELNNGEKYQPRAQIAWTESGLEQLLKISVEKIVEAQKNSSVIKSYRKWSQDHKIKVAPQGEDMISLEKIFRNFSQEGGVVVYGEPTDYRKALYAPSSIRKEILQVGHEGPEAGHFGPIKTLHRIRQQFAWPKMQEEVRKYVENCTLCQMTQKQRKLVIKEQEFERHPPMKFLAADICEMEKSERGNKGILVVIDRNTRWTELIPIKDFAAKTVIRKLDQQIVRTFGPFQKIQTDNGSSFSEEFTKYVKSLCAEHVTGLPYQHTTNGMVERAIRTTRQVLRSFSKVYSGDWDQWITPAQLALNTSLHSATKVTPFKNLFGIEANSRLQNQLKLLKENEKTRNFQVIDWVQKQAEEEDLKQLEMRHRKQSKLPVDKFKVGEYVRFMPPEELEGPKQESRIRGPYKITEIEAKGNLKVEHPAEPEIFEIIHPSKARLSCGPNQLASLMGEEIPSQNLNLLDGKKFDPGAHKVILKILGKATNLKQFNPKSLIGEEVVVRWSQAKAKGDWPGIIMDYNPVTKRYYVKYQQASDDGKTVYEENLLGKRAVKWWERRTKT